MPLEAALTDLRLAQGDLAQARSQAERFLQVWRQRKDSLSRGVLHENEL
jgi:hypothetical protein